MTIDEFRASTAVPLLEDVGPELVLGNPKLPVIDVGRAPSLKVKAWMLTKDENGGGLPRNIDAAFITASHLIVEGS